MARFDSSTALLGGFMPLTGLEGPIAPLLDFSDLKPEMPKMPEKQPETAF